MFTMCLFVLLPIYLILKYNSKPFLVWSWMEWKRTGIPFWDLVRKISSTLLKRVFLSVLLLESSPHFLFGEMLSPGKEVRENLSN